jgi:hypothetical protein
VASEEVAAEEFPYLVVRLLPGAYQLLPLRKGRELEDLLAIARRHRDKVRRYCCLTLGRTRALYLRPDGTEAWSDSPPRGGVWFGPEVIGLPPLEE